MGLDLEVFKGDKKSPCVPRLRDVLNQWLLDDATWKKLEVILTNVNRKKRGLDPVGKDVCI